MKILFLVPYPLGEAPSQRFRFEQYFSLLTNNNIEYSVSSFWGLKAWEILYLPGYRLEKICWILAGFGRRWIDVVRCISFDLIFIHRECTPIGPPFMEFLIAKVLRKKIIYDFDDAIWLENTSVENSIARLVKFHSKVKSICRWSFKISAGNAWLADFARQFNSNVIINPTTIDTKQLHRPSKKILTADNRIIIGWTGTHSTLYYLKSLVPVLKSIEEKYKVKIQIISNKKPDLGLKSLEYIPWHKGNEIEQLARFDIGLMPLDDEEWAKGKCGFKALQYMALEIPCLASAVGVNVKIIDHLRNGFICVTEQDWLDAIEALINNPQIRNEVGKEGRKKIVEDYSVDSNSTNFLSLIRL